MTAPDVSVVIPVQNGERFLREAVASVLAQTGFSKEIIVVDNNSTDETLAVARSLEGPVTVTSESEPGAAAARNHGMRMATGKYLAFLDADDLWMEGKLEKQIRALAAGVEISLTYCREFADPGADRELSGRLVCRPEPYPCLLPSSMAVLRATASRVGEMPAIPGGEFVAWFGWARALGMRAAVIDDICVMRRVHASNSSRTSVVRGGYPEAAKWVLERRRQAQQTPAA